MDIKDYKWTHAVINDYGISMTARMIAILKSHGSQNLVNQIDQQVIDDMNNIMLEIKMPEWGYYSSEGRAAGKFPPLNSIADWMQSRNIDMVALYPIARKIASLGTKASASHFLKEFKIDDKFKSDLLDAYCLDIEQELISVVNEINNK